MNIYIKTTESKGKTMFAAKDFVKDEVIFVVAGSIVDFHSIYTIPIAKDLCIDPLSGFGKELCHSCDPNCGIKNRTQIVAMKDVKKGEEITIDYAMIVLKYGNEMTEENRICKCGSPNCRGKLGAYPELPEKVKKKYEGYVSEFLEEEKK